MPWLNKVAVDELDEEPREFIRDPILKYMKTNAEHKTWKDLQPAIRDLFKE